MSACLLHNAFVASVLCRDDAVSVLIVCFSFSFLHDIIDYYHPLHQKHQAKVTPAANRSHTAEMIELIAACALFISIV